MQRGPPRRRGVQDTKPEYRFEAFLSPGCRHCKRFEQEISKNMLMASQTQWRNAPEMKRAGTLPPWMRKVPTIIDHQPIVTSGTGRSSTSKRGEPMVYSGTDAFRFVDSWFSETGVPMVSKKMRHKGSFQDPRSLFSTPHASGAGGNLFDNIDEEKMAQARRIASLDPMKQRAMVDSMAKAMAQSRGGQRR